MASGAQSYLGGFSNDLTVDFRVVKGFWGPFSVARVPATGFYSLSSISVVIEASEAVSAGMLVPKELELI